MSELPERGPGGHFLPRTPASERNPERQKLAAAIGKLRALDGQLKRLVEARGRLGLRDKDRAHATACRALDEARQRAPEMLVAKMMGEEFDPAQTVDTAKGLLEDAERELDEATEADQLLADEIGVVEGRRELARYARDNALTRVVHGAPEIAELRDRIERTRQQMHDFSWVCSAIGLRRLPFHWDGVLQGPDGGHGAPWKAALAALEEDPDAELPGE